MIQTAIHADLEAEFAAVAASSGCELVHVEFRSNTLRVFLDRPEGVTLDDCSAVSRELSALLDVHGFGNKRYLLEVSSPGLDRQLYGPRDYQRFVGRRVRVTHVSDGTKQTLVGRLESFQPAGEGDREADGEADGGTITVVAEPAGKRHLIALGDIRRARLEIEL